MESPTAAPATTEREREVRDLLSALCAPLDSATLGRLADASSMYHKTRFGRPADIPRGPPSDTQGAAILALLRVLKTPGRAGALEEGLLHQARALYPCDPSLRAAAVGKAWALYRRGVSLEDVASAKAGRKEALAEILWATGILLVSGEIAAAPSGLRELVC